MATVPLSWSDVRFLSGVPFSSDYKHTRWFDTKSQQESYFLNKNVVHQMQQATYVKIDGKEYIAVNASVDDLWSTNYVMFRNTSYNNKWFYAFVTKLEYKNSRTTHVHFKIDVFQTWRFEMNFQPSFVIREHRPLWEDDGQPVINTIDEGLNYGTDYEIVDVQHYSPNGGYKWLVIISKTPIHSGADSKVNASVIGTPQPLTYYIIPFKDDDKTPSVRLNNDDTEGNPITPPTRIMNEIYKDEKAVNNIVSIYVTEYTGIPVKYVSGSDTNTPDVLTFTNDKNKINSVQIGELYVLHVEKVVDFEVHKWESSQGVYANYDPVHESKLLMYPYSLTVIDDFKGNRIEIKNEYLRRTDTDKYRIEVKGSLGLSNKVSYALPDYNYGGLYEKSEIANENALINNNPADLPVINDYLAAFLQGNRNSINNQKDAILFNGIMGGVSNTVGGVASAAMGNPMGVAASGGALVQGAGSTVLQLQAIEAKQKDIANVPPQISKMGSNTAYDFGNGYNGIFIIKKQLKVEYRKKLNDFFNMYGYKTNEVKNPNFHTRKYWNYVQTASCVIRGDFNNEDLEELKAIFDNGITLWHTDDIGNYDLENEVVA